MGVCYALDSVLSNAVDLTNRGRKKDENMENSRIILINLSRFGGEVLVSGGVTVFARKRKR